MTEILNKAVLQKVQDLYDVAKDAEVVEEVAMGSLSHNYVLKTPTGKLFLKQYRFDDPEKIRSIHEVKFFFAKGGIPVVLPIQNKDKEFLFEADGKFYSLFPFAEGRIIDKVSRSIKAAASAGRMLGKIHALSKNGYPEIAEGRTEEFNRENLIGKAKQLQGAIEALTNIQDFDRMAAKTLDLKIKIAEANTVQYDGLGLKSDHLVHGDYHQKNIFYDENDEVKYIFDLEKAKLDPRALELARAIDYMCFAEEWEDANFECGKALLDGYNEIYPISNDELARGFKAFYLKKAHSLWVEKEHYLEHNSRVDQFLPFDLAMLEYYSENLDEFLGRLTS